MFKFILLISSLMVACAFNVAPVNRFGSSLQMSTEKVNAPKVMAAAIIASSCLSSPAFAVEGAGAKLGIFSNSDISSPFPQAEKREDSIYSAYSPYGDGSAAAYNKRKGGSDEIKFYSEIFDESVKRTEKIPGYVSKKTWNEITTELTRYTYNMREAMLRLAAASPNAAASTANAKAYFSDINDIFEWATKKDAGKITQYYTESVADLKAFKAGL